MPALLPQVTRSYMLTDEQQQGRHADAAAVLLCVLPRHCEVVWHNLRALICRPQLALSQPGSLQVLLVCVVRCMGCAVRSQEKTLVFREDTPFTVRYYFRKSERTIFTNLQCLPTTGTLKAHPNQGSPTTRALIAI